jgi:hypothetical protein
MPHCIKVPEEQFLFLRAFTHQYLLNTPAGKSNSRMQIPEKTGHSIFHPEYMSDIG